jgi:hypothetical protein
MTWQLLLLIAHICFPVRSESTIPSYRDRHDLHQAAATAKLDVIDTVNFGRTTVGRFRDTVITIVLNRATRQAVTNLAGPIPLQFQIGNLQIDSNGQGVARLAIRFRPTSAAEARARVIIVQPGDTTGDSIIIPLAGRGDTSFIISTQLSGGITWTDSRDSIDFGNVPLDSCRSMLFRIVNRSAARSEAGFSLAKIPGSPFKLSNGDTVGSLVSIDTGATYHQLYFCPNDTGQTSGTVTIWTPAGPRTYYLRGRGVAPRISVTPAALTFSGAGECRNDSIIVRNNGESPLFVRISIDAGDSILFTIIQPNPANGKQIVLQSGESYTIVLRFCGWGSAEAVVTLRSNDPDSVRQVPIHVKGTGWLTAAEKFRFTTRQQCETQSQVLRYQQLDTLLRPDTLVVWSHYFYAGSQSHFSFDSTALPIRLADQDTLSVRVTFCSDVYDLQFTDTLYLVNSNRDKLIAIPVIGTRVTERLLTVSPQTIDFTQVDTGTCQERSFEIINGGNRADTITSSDLLVDRGGATLTIVEPRPDSLPRRLAAGERMTVRVRYCPAATDSLSARWIGGSKLNMLSVLIRGVGRARTTEPVEEQTVWIDSAEATAGSTLSLMVRVAPGIRSGASVTGYRLRIDFDPRALYPIDAIDAGSKRAIVFDRDSAATGALILARSGLVIVGSDLVALRFRGLSSGHDSNWVRFVEGSLDSTRALRAGAPGLVRLYGCDIDRPISLDRRASIRNVSIDGSQAVLRFTAPAGSTALLRLMSSAGDLVSTVEIPSNGGAEQTTPIDLRSVPPGFYILELRVGDGRSSIPLMIAR